MRLFWVLFLAGCATTSGYNRLPDPVTGWLESNVWRVETMIGGGSGFWANGQFVTACHIIDSSRAAFIYNSDRSRSTLTEVSVCDKIRDIAILVPIDSPTNTLADFEPVPIKLAAETPEPGTIIYSAGWQMGGPLGYSAGILNNKSENGYETEMYLIFGDSGSPALAIKDGEIQLIGIMLSINSISQMNSDGEQGQEIPIFGSSVMHGIEDIKAILEINER